MPHHVIKTAAPVCSSFHVPLGFISAPALAWFPQLVFRSPCIQASWALTLGLPQQWVLSTYWVPGTVLDPRDITRNKTDTALLALIPPTPLHYQSSRASEGDSKAEL